VALVTFYGDDSGTDDKTNVAVAGYVSDKLRWDEFGDRWQKLLDEEDIEVFHRTDMEGPPYHGNFKDWTKPRMVRVLREAHRIIRRARIRGFGNSVRVKAYHQIFPKNLKTAFGGTYGWCADACVAGVGKWANAKGHWVTYIFEAGTKGRNEVDIAMRSLSKDPKDREKYRIANWDFAPKKGPGSVIQLQAADFLAYETYKYIDNQVVAGIRRKFRTSAQQLLDERDRVMYWGDDQIMRWLVQGMDKPDVADLLTGKVKLVKRRPLP
jgi:hypothetical protein